MALYLLGLTSKGPPIRPGLPSVYVGPPIWPKIIDILENVCMACPVQLAGTLFKNSKDGHGHGSLPCTLLRKYLTF